MDLTWLLVEQILSMVLMAAAGFVLGKKRLVTGEQSRVLSCFCVYLVVPCSMINAFAGTSGGDKLTGLAIGLVCSAAVFLLHYLVNFALSKVKNGLTREEQSSTIFTNAGNLIIPMVHNILGAEYVIYNSPYMLIQNILMWTYGQKLMGGQQKFDIKKTVLHPAIMGIEIGFLLFICKIRLPGFIEYAISGLSSCIAPISMVVTGILMSELDLKEILASKRVYLVVGVRLLLMPLLCIPMLMLFNRILLHGETAKILTVCLLSAIGPTASTVVQQASLYKNPHASYVSSINVLSTLCCAITMPTMNAIFQFLIK